MYRITLKITTNSLLLAVVALLAGTILAGGQALPARKVNTQFQTWVSVNSVMRFTEHWGLMADMHVRRNNGVQDPSFYFARAGADYWIHDKFTVAAGYAHLWLAPTTANWKTFSNEHRIYQQTVFIGTAGKTGLVHRLRNEQRWMQKMKDDKPSGDWKFTNRVRYLINLNFPIARTKGKMSVVVADEIFLQLGKEVVFNTFDQNRLFVGIKNRLNKNWSYDIGYMNVYQQKANGYQYDLNHTFRWFFYFTPDYRKKHPEQMHTSVLGVD